MKVISVLNIKGGVGKTTTSINLAAGAAKKGKRVLLVDLDGQANSTAMLMDHSYSKDEMTVVDCLIDPTMTKEAIIKTPHGFDLLPSRLDLFVIETSILIDVRKAQHNRLLKIIQEVKEKYDLIIVDCNPSLGIMTTNAIYACKNRQGNILIPIKIDKGATDGFVTTISFIEDMNEKYDMDVDYQILVTMKNRNNLDKALIEDLGQIAPGKLLNTQIRNQSKPITEAGYTQLPVINNIKANVGEDYRLLVEEMFGVNCPRGRKEVSV
ncbi:MAG: ParA family protein [Anaerorhabdus sp.]